MKPNNNITSTGIYIASYNRFSDNPDQSYTIVAQLNAETNEGVPISLRDEITILSSILTVTRSIDPTTTHTHTPTPPTPEVEYLVPIGALVIVLISSFLLLTLSYVAVQQYTDI